ncbi:MAG: HAD hydrolase-like protein [Nanoarchaeota archaeon]
MIELIVFDFDGTLADTKAIILRIIKKKLPELGYTPSKRLLHSLGKMPLNKSLSLLTKDKEKIAEIQKYLRVELNESIKKFTPAEGFYKLRELKQRKIILSNSISLVINDSLSNFKADFFDEIYASDNFNNKAEKFLEIIKEANLKKEEVIYVGDMGVDASLAKDIGCASVIVFGPASWSTLPEIVKAKPDFIISSLNELGKIINQTHHKTLRGGFVRPKKSSAYD